MKKLMVCLACCVLFMALASRLHAAQPAPAAQADLAAQIFAPADSPAVAAPADPAKAAPSDLFMPEPRLTSCTVTVCIRNCNDCPVGHHGICLSTATCTCGCS
jgi:hypothetical protein